MTDGRPGPRQSKKSAGRAGGGSTRRAAESPRRSPDAPRRASEGTTRRSEETRRGTADDKGRGRFDEARRGRRDDTRRASEGRRGSAEGGIGRSGSAGRPGSPRGDRERDRLREAEPGFGPFRGRQRDGVPGAPKRQPVDEEARAVRSVAEEAVARAAGEQRPALRIVHGEGTAERGAKSKPGGRAKATRRAAAPAAPRPRATRDGNRLQEALIRGSRALDRGYEREALRILRPWREAHPDSVDLRELLGLTYYRLGKWAMAEKELGAFVELTGSTEQHPVLMDCARALGRFKRVNALWEELGAASPGAEIVSEGRIVHAGALGDQGRLNEAIKVLERAPASPKRVLPHHLRLWYALADLHERAGDIPAARALFRKISAQDPSFVDVAERLASLS